MKKVIIIGGSGFLGSQLIKELQHQNIEFFAVIHETDIDGIPEDHKIRGGIGGVNSRLIDDIDPDYIIHVARPKMPKLRKLGRWLAGRKAEKLNTDFLKELKKTNSKPHLLFASGSLMYGNVLSPVRESAKEKPISYAEKYYKGEVPVWKAARDKSYPIKVFRLPWLLGDGSWFKWFYLENITKKNRIPVFKKGRNNMQILDIHDAARLFLKCGQESVMGIINMYSPHTITQIQFAELIHTIVKADMMDYHNIFPNLEEAAKEAFTSNIMMDTKYPELFNDYPYIELEESLRSLLKDK